MVLTLTNTYDSSTIVSTKYTLKTGVLEVSFKHATYEYPAVTRDEYESFVNAKSQGKALNEIIKPDRSFRKLFNKLESEENE